MLSEGQKKLNRKEYFKKALNCKKIKLILIGQGPYPDGNDNGIAFCKDKISDLNITCFPTICVSLRFEYELLSDVFSNDGKKLFDHLMGQGIIFMNLSYELLASTDSPTKTIKDTVNLNRDIIDNVLSANPRVKVVRLGKSYEKLYLNNYADFPGEVILHPARRAGIVNRKEWDKYWSTDYLHKTYLK
jgi:uracil DNA glycosylase